MVWRGAVIEDLVRSQPAVMSVTAERAAGITEELAAYEAAFAPHVRQVNQGRWFAAA